MNLRIFFGFISGIYCFKTNLDQNKSYIFQVPFIETTYEIEGPSIIESNEDHDYLVAGVGLDIVNGVTGSCELTSENALIPLGNGFYNINKIKMPSLIRWLKPNMFFKIRVEKLKSQKKHILMSTLLYADSDKTVIVVTRTLGRVLKPFLWIWMFTHNLLVISQEVEMIKSLSWNENKEKVFQDSVNFSTFISDAQIFRGPDYTVHNIPNEFFIAYKVNIYNYLVNYVEDNKKASFLEWLLAKNRILPNLTEILFFKPSLEILYEKIKWNRKINYEKFPMYDILIRNDAAVNKLSVRELTVLIRYRTPERYALVKPVK